MASILGKSIDDFKSAVSKRGGVAAANRFAVYMQPPEAALVDLDIGGIARQVITGNFSAERIINDPRDLAILCESCSLPGRQITTLDYQSVRHSQKLPTGYVNDDVSFVFHLTEDYFVKRMFDKWTSSVIDFKRYRVRYQNEYTTDVVIHQLDKQNLPIYGVRLKKAYPITVSAVALDNTAENQGQKLNVTLAFEDFVEEGAIESTVSAVQTGIGGIRRILNIGS